MLHGSPDKVCLFSDCCLVFTLHPSIHFVLIYMAPVRQIYSWAFTQNPKSELSVSFWLISGTSSLYNKASCLYVPSWKHVETLCFTALEGIRYCSHNIFADNGVLPDYDVFDNVILSHDNFRSFSEALLNTINCLENPAQKNDKRITMDSIKIEEDFCAFWKQLVPKYWHVNCYPLKGSLNIFCRNSNSRSLVSCRLDWQY